MRHPATSPAQPRLLLFINPISGSGRGAGAGSEAVARLRSAGAEVRVVETPRALSATPADRAEHAYGTHQALVSALRTEVEEWVPDAVVVVGGDGMVHAAVNVLAQTGIPLALVPAGTGNDFARNFGLDRLDTADSIHRILAGLDRGAALAVDLLHVELGAQTAPATAHVAAPAPATASASAPARSGEPAPRAAGTRWVAATVNLGFDAVVNARANTLTRLSGRGRYVGAVLRELWAYRAPVLEVEVHQGPTTRLPTFVLSVMNGRFFGGGMQAAPSARPDDGLLDTLWVPALNPWRFLQIFPRVFSGRHATVPEVRLDQHRGVTVRHIAGPRAPAPPTVHGDGEPLGALPARITVAPGALRLLGQA